jgi:hypothetical protein
VSMSVGPALDLEDLVASKTAALVPLTELPISLDTAGIPDAPQGCWLA